MVIKKIRSTVLITLWILLSTADLLMLNHKLVNVFLYLLLILKVISKIDYTKKYELSCSILWIMITSILSTIHFSNIDLILWLKITCIGLIFLVPIRPLGDKKPIFLSVEIAFNLLCLLGLYQIIQVLFFNQVLFEGSIRPIGLSAEPTWFSQQLLVLFLLKKREVNTKFHFKLIQTIIFTVNIIATFTRTTILVLFTRIFRVKNLLYLLLIFCSVILLIPFVEDIELFKGIIYKVQNLQDFRKEPRFIALNHMINITQDNFWIGNGFYSTIESQSGLMVGAKYAMLPMSLFYIYGIFGCFLYLLLLLGALFQVNSKIKTLLFVSLFFSLFMPYLLSIFSLTIILLAKYQNE